MSINTIFKLDKIVLASGQELHTLTNEQQQFGIQTLVERSAGEPWPNFIANQSQRPTIGFSTKALATLLTNVGVGGNYSLTNVTAYLKQGTGSGSVARASTVHERMVVAESCVYWTSIRLPHNGTGEGQVSIVPVYDGSNDPIAFTGSVALSGTLSAAAYFGAGPVAINDVVIPGIQEISIDSGVQLLQLGASSEEFDTFVGLETGQVVVTIKTMEQTNWAALGLRGTALDGVDGLLFYARKYAAGGSRVANATAEHIKFEGLAGKCIPVDTSGQDSSPVTDTLRVELINASSGPGLTVTVGSAIA